VGKGSTLVPEFLRRGIKLKFSLQLASLATAVALAAVPSFAQPISLSITGNTQVTATDILFNTNPSGSGSYAAPGSYGVFAVNAPVASIFASNGIVSGQLGNILSLSATTTPVGVPVIPPSLFMNFINGSGPGGTGTGSNLALYLTMLQQGTFVPGSPFIFTNTPNGAVAQFNVNGFVLDTTTMSQTAYAGVFSATFAGMTTSQLCAAYEQYWAGQYQLQRNVRPHLRT